MLGFLVTPVHTTVVKIKNLIFFLPPQVPTLTVEGHTFNLFDRVRVTISLDASNIQHQKIRMSLLEPVVSSCSVLICMFIFAWALTSCQDIASFIRLLFDM